ncbi:MAG: hypothetical protein M1820_010397 [Bogoriella megaspora]|nr:MAG: hypothetical protein M1820_010397 [Bogoriella megaspora]
MGLRSSLIDLIVNLNTSLNDIAQEKIAMLEAQKAAFACPEPQYIALPISSMRVCYYMFLGACITILGIFMLELHLGNTGFAETIKGSRKKYDQMPEEEGQQSLTPSLAPVKLAEPGYEVLDDTVSDSDTNTVSTPSSASSSLAFDPAFIPINADNDTQLDDRLGDILRRYPLLHYQGLPFYVFFLAGAANRNGAIILPTFHKREKQLRSILAKLEELALGPIHAISWIGTKFHALGVASMKHAKAIKNKALSYKAVRTIAKTFEYISTILHEGIVMLGNRSVAAWMKIESFGAGLKYGLAVAWSVCFTLMLACCLVPEKSWELTCAYVAELWNKARSPFVSDKDWTKVHKGEAKSI